MQLVVDLRARYAKEIWQQNQKWQDYRFQIIAQQTELLQQNTVTKNQLIKNYRETVLEIPRKTLNRKLSKKQKPKKNIVDSCFAVPSLNLEGTGVKTF